MKALKEKRISLRSLWRRGLVILSLFALVFASCGDSSSSGDDSSGGLRVVEISVASQPTEDQYLGQPVDLTGMELTVKYNDGSKKTVPFDGKNFSAVPDIYTGWYDTAGNFYGMPDCEVIYGGQSATALFYGQGSNSVGRWGIVRANTNTYGTMDSSIWGKDEEYYSMGLNLTGTAAKVVYVDQDSPGSGLLLL